MANSIMLTPENAGAVAAWVREKTHDSGSAILRGGPKGGSLGASVGLKDAAGARHWAEPGDTIALGMGGQPYIVEHY